MPNAYEILRVEDRMDALDAYSETAHDLAEEAADETCDMFALEGAERNVYWDKVYRAEYDRLMEAYEKAL